MDSNFDELDSTERIEIFSTDHEKIKLFGELLSNDSSRAILQILFEKEITANDLSQETGISLQLVKYHIIKMQELGIVKVSKTEKNSKGHDMKFYKANKFAVVILPAKVTERAKESKLLKHSFKSIYKFMGIGVAAVASLFSISLLQEKPTENVEIPPALPNTDSGGGYMGDSGQAGSGVLEETLELARRRIEAGEANPASGSGTPFIGMDLFIEIMIAIAIVGAAASLYFFWKAHKHSKKQKLEAKNYFKSVI